MIAGADYDDFGITGRMDGLRGGIIQAQARNPPGVVIRRLARFPRHGNIKATG